MKPPKSRRRTSVDPPKAPPLLLASPADSAMQRGRSELQDYIDNMSTFNAKLDTSGRFILIGKVAQQATGFSYDELAKMNFLEGPWWSFDAEVQARVRDAFRKAVSGETVNYVERALVAGNIVLTLSFSLYPVKGANGQVDYIVAEGRDITHLIETEAKLMRSEAALREANEALEQRVLQRTAQLSAATDALRESEQRLQAILDNSMAIVYTKDLEGRYLLVNRAWEEVSQAPRSAALGKTAFEIYPPEVARIINLNDNEVLKSGTPMQFEEVVPRKSGLRTYVSVKFPLLDSAGKPWALCGISTDITERKQIELSVIESEARKRAILYSALDCVISIDGEGKVLEWNPASERTFGYSNAEAMGRTIAELIVPKYLRERHTKGLARFMSTGFGPVLGKRLEINALRKDGSEFLAELAITHVPVSGPPVFTAYLRDISDRSRMENALRFSAEASAILASSLDYQATLKSVAQLAVPGIADWFSIDLVDKDGSIKRVAATHPNKELLSVANEMHKRNPINTATPLGIAQIIRDGKSAVVTEITDEIIVATARSAEQLDFNRRLGLISCMVVPLIARGKVLGAISFATSESGRHYTSADLPAAEDLAHRAAIAVDNAVLYQQAQLARSEAEATNRTKDEFLAVVSHELRTPLTPILGWTRLLQTAKFDSLTMQRGLESIERNVKAQSQLIDDLLDISRIVSGKLRLNIRAIQLDSIVRAAIDTMRPAADARQIALNVNLDSRQVEFAGDPDRLQQVVWNLISNAVKFSRGNSRVEIALTHTDHAAQITVVDFGEGISPEFLPHMFVRFTQADSSTTRVHGGLGLGLAIVRHIVELHGGTVTAFSKGKGEGSMFTVSIPLAKMPADKLVMVPPEYRTPGEIAGPVPDIKGVRVLVVDDDSDSREFVAQALQQWGAKVTTAASVDEATRTLELLHPDILISDIGMPVKDGYVLIREIRQNASPRLRDIPAIALTAYARAEDRIRVLAEGFQMHVPKPLDPIELATAVANVVQRHGKRPETQ